MTEIKKQTLTADEIQALADAYLLKDISEKKYKSVKATLTDGLASTQTADGNKPYELDGVAKVTVAFVDGRDSIDEEELRKYLPQEKIDACKKKSKAFSQVTVRVDKAYAVEFEQKIQKGFDVLDKLDAVTEKVKAKLIKMLAKSVEE